MRIIIIILSFLLTTTIKAAFTFESCAISYSMHVTIDLHVGDTMYIDQYVSGEWINYDYLTSWYGDYYGDRENEADSLRTRFVIQDSFSYFFYGFYYEPDNFQSECPAPLPITLVEFAYKNGYVYWRTEFEFNFNHFELEVSEDISRWETVYSGNNYQFKPNQTGYYRLKAVDNDGSFDYSKIIQVSIEEPTGVCYDAYGRIIRCDGFYFNSNQGNYRFK